MIPDWLIQVVIGSLLSMIGYIVLRIDRKLDRMEERQAKMEKDCVTWADLEKTHLQVMNHDCRLTRIETICANHHEKK